MAKYNIVLASSDENDDHEVTVINSLFAKQVDGIIFSWVTISDGKIVQNFLVPVLRIVLAGTVDLEHHYRALTSTIKPLLRILLHSLLKIMKRLLLYQTTNSMILMAQNSV